MPELPEVETTKTSLLPLIGKTVCDVLLSGQRLREPIANLDVLIGKKLHSVQRRAKYLLVEFADNDNKSCDRMPKVLLIHLGMSGSLGQYPKALRRKHDHVIIKLADTKDEVYLHYYDPRRFGMVMWADEARRYLDKLGVEPLSDDFDGHYLWQIIHKNPNRPIARPIKSVIMEQKIVVGVGNIYAAESLFLTKINPLIPAYLLDKKTLASLVDNIKAVLAKSILAGGTSLKDFSVADNKTGYFQRTLLVYGKEDLPCPNCLLPLENVKIAGRASVFCPSCQPLRS